MIASFGKYHWPGNPLLDDEDAIGIRFPVTGVGRWFVVAPLRKSRSNVASLRVVGRLHDENGSCRINFRIRIPVVLNAFTAIGFALPLVVGAVFLFSVGSATGESLIAFGCRCP
jgi:hypothetical protein